MNTMLCFFLQGEVGGVSVYYEVLENPVFSYIPFRNHKIFLLQIREMSSIGVYLSENVLFHAWSCKCLTLTDMLPNARAPRVFLIL